VDAASARLIGSLGADLAAPTATLVEQLDRDSEETDAALQGLRSAPARTAGIRAGEAARAALISSARCVPGRRAA
ncbi:MAG TPA: hypothetical protein VLV90_02120, partial [Burkholderiales bacterium]|nr:hypothetical protein [Burkholderiales bacterium]